MENNRRVKIIGLIIVIIALIGLTIAFAAMSRTLKINGRGNVDPANFDIYFDNLSEASTNGQAQTSGTPTLATKGAEISNINITLKQPKDSVTYTVDIVNEGDVDAEISNITLPTLTNRQQELFEFTAEYTQEQENGTHTIAVGDMLYKNESKNITITFKYKDITDESKLPSNPEEITLSYAIEYVQSNRTKTATIQEKGLIITSSNVAYTKTDTTLKLPNPDGSSTSNVILPYAFFGNKKLTYKYFSGSGATEYIIIAKTLNGFMLVNSTNGLYYVNNTGLNSTAVAFKYLGINYNVSRPITLEIVDNDTLKIGSTTITKSTLETALGNNDTFEYLQLGYSHDFRNTDSLLTYEVEDEIEQSNLDNVTSGKNFSILADSISTYTGYSNDTNANSTIGTNKVYYTGSNSGITNVNQTWWMQVINQTNMKLLVNNSSSGSKVIGKGNVSGSTIDQGYGIRTQNLHDDTGDRAGTNPDVIAIFMGINNFNANTTLGDYNNNLYNTLITDNGNGTFSYNEPTNFTEAYIIMVHKVITKYNNADVFCFTLLPNNVRTDYTALEQYNDTIRNIANHFNIDVVDLYRNSGITTSNYSNYSNDTNKLHPNQTGMTAIANTVINKFSDKYLQ